MGINPVRYVKKTLEVLIFAFTSRSSAGAEKLAIPSGTPNRCVWVWMFKGNAPALEREVNATGIYPAMLAIMVAPVANVDIDLPFVLTLIGVVIISYKYPCKCNW
jgi:L-cystine uptake protein TcyP (sodium:dicarboxylate symporter family)